MNKSKECSTEAAGCRVGQSHGVENVWVASRVDSIAPSWSARQRCRVNAAEARGGTRGLLGSLVLSCSVALVGCGDDEGAPALNVAADAAATTETEDTSNGTSTQDGQTQLPSDPDASAPTTGEPGDGGPLEPEVSLRINELMASNDGAWVDELGETDDWVELVNASLQPISLTGWTLVDRSGRLGQLPELTLNPSERVVLWADGQLEQGERHLPFKLSASGDELTLRAPDGAIADQVTIDTLALNESLARFPDASGEWERCRYASPRRSNGDECAPRPPVELEDDVEFAPYAFPEPFPPRSTPLQIAELALRPAGFVELLNTSDEVVSIENYQLKVSPHRPGVAWPTVEQGAALPLPNERLEPGDRLVVPVGEADVATLSEDPNFEGVVTLYAADEQAIDRVDFMHWPAGASLALYPETQRSFQFCTEGTPGEPNTCDPLLAREVGDRVRALRTPGDFSALAEGTTQLGIESVKFIWDMQSGGVAHLLSGRRWALHYTFVREMIEGLPSLDRCDADENREFYQGWSDFSQLEYFRVEGRRFLLGTLSKHSGSDLWAVEHALGDVIEGPQMAEAFFNIVPRTFEPKRWVLRPQDDTQIERARAVEGQLPMVGPNAPFVGVDYQPLTPGVAYGTLRFVPAEELQVTALGPQVIVVTDDVPNDIPLVGGLITEALQTPLAHVNVLSQNRGTPNAALRHARSELSDYFEQLVRLEVAPGGIDVRLAEPAEAQAYWDSLGSNEPALAPRLDTSVRGVQPLSEHSLESLPMIGAKAAQLAELGRINVSYAGCPSSSVPIAVPRDGFAIPVVHYLEHFEASGASARLEQLREQPDFQDDPLVRAAGLAQVRELMLEHAVDPELLSEVEVAVEQRFGQERVRFRSSSNAEDLPKFNGAGLYTSMSGEYGNPERSIEDAMRVVWASLWNARAHDERRLGGVDESTLGMGILVHLAALSEEVNGVAVSRNVLDPTRGDIYYINTQVGEATVTNPAPSVTTEQLVYRWNREPPIIYHSHSSLLEALGDPPTSVMSSAEVEQVACALRAIHQWFKPLIDPQGDDPWFAMEIEFKRLDGERALHIKQARPHPFAHVADFGDCREL